MTQSVEVVKVDQGAGHGDPISSEPIVEIAPTANGIVNHGDEHYEEVAPPFVEEVPAIVEEDKAQVGQVAFLHLILQCGSHGLTSFLFVYSSLK